MTEDQWNAMETASNHEAGARILSLVGWVGLIALSLFWGWYLARCYAGRPPHLRKRIERRTLIRTCATTECFWRDQGTRWFWYDLAPDERWKK